MQSNASLVAELRKKTGVGLNECVQAIKASNGNIDEAIRWLKIRNIKTDSPNHTDIRNGIISIQVADGRKRVAMIEISSESDLSNNPDFNMLANRIAFSVLETPVGTVTEALDLNLGDKKVRQVMHELGDALRDNLRLTHVTALSFAKRRYGAIGTYLHSDRKLASMLGLVTPVEEHISRPEFQNLLNDISLHIAGSPIPPQVISTTDLPIGMLTNQLNIFKAQMNLPENAKKPENVKEKIIAGKMTKFSEEISLMEQPFIKDPTGKKKIRDIVEDTSKALGSEIQIDWFIRRTFGMNS